MKLGWGPVAASSCSSSTGASAISSSSSIEESEANSSPSLVIRRCYEGLKALPGATLPSSTIVFFVRKPGSAERFARSSLLVLKRASRLAMLLAFLPSSSLSWSNGFASLRMRSTLIFLSLIYVTSASAFSDFSITYFTSALLIFPSVYSL